jgi:hypothetical protein
VFFGKEFELLKKEARIFADYCVPGQIGIPLLLKTTAVDSRNGLIFKNDKSISKFFDMAIE